MNLLQPNLSNECVEEFQKFSMGKGASHIIYKLDDGKVVIEHLGGNEETWEDMRAKLPDSEPRYCTFHYHYDLGTFFFFLNF
jgi:hypothetical protein